MTELEASGKLTYLWSVGSAITRNIPYYLSEVFGILNNINVTQHFQMREICCDRWDLESESNKSFGQDMSYPSDANTDFE